MATAPVPAAEIDMNGELFPARLDEDRFRRGYRDAIEGVNVDTPCPVYGAGRRSVRRQIQAAVSLFAERSPQSWHDAELAEVFGRCVCCRCQLTEELR